MKILMKLLSDEGVKKRYKKAGAIFGDALSYIYMGECIGFEMLLDRLIIWEEEYASRGYRTINLGAFVDFGGYGKPIGHLLGQKLKEDEEPVFHAKIYREKFLGKVKPVIELEKMLKGQKQSGSYKLPSEEK